MFFRCCTELNRVRLGPYSVSLFVTLHSDVVFLLLLALGFKCELFENRSHYLPIKKRPKKLSSILILFVRYLNSVAFSCSNCM